jgi:peptide/nickel transport system substrate-binding protein
VAAVADGRADFVEDYYDPVAFRQVRDVPLLRVGKPAVFGFAMLLYNMRPGQLFADQRLRQAIELCVDKPAIVAAATEGQAVPAYADVAPGTWAYDAALPEPVRDVTAAKQLIESAGWSLGSDGIYQNAGRRLAATIHTRSDAIERVKAAELISLETRDCGMDLTLAQGDFSGNLGQLHTWPNTGPGTDKPFDLYLLGWVNTFDPSSRLFDPGDISTEQNPYGSNIGGISDSRLTDILAKVRTIYDIDQRAALYRQYQEVLAEEQPALFLWHESRLDAAASALRTIDGPLDLNATRWYAFPERLVKD